ncbi:hypothetical protein EC973_002260 [Apophysomyces ossiformis]|uniref:WHIM1 domain-containing protein n=1 Tax=Apophysomyces ossiformis TaxID=679940 RepID=A0A8H7ESK1_9FUNG|nr:hypothetical protein EC973_002260 [Apophysomyces ossiformis]
MHSGNDGGKAELSPYKQWQIAFIYAFVVAFNQGSDLAGLHTLPAFDPEELENALQQENSDLLEQLLCAFLSNVLNRKKPIEPSSYARALSDLVSSKVRSFEFDLGYNPLTAEGFKALTPEHKLTLLQSLVEWQLQDSNAVRAIIEQFCKNTKKAEFHLGLTAKNELIGGLVLLNNARFTMAMARKGEYKKWMPMDNRNLNELREFSSTLSTSNRAERNLCRRITDELIPLIEEKQRVQEKKDRAKARQIAMELAFTPRELRPRDRRKRTRYNYDDMFDDIEDIGDDYSESSLAQRPERPRPTRISSRLNPGLSSDSLDIEGQLPTPETVENAEIGEIRQEANVEETNGEEKQEVESGDILID